MTYAVCLTDALEKRTEEAKMENGPFIIEYIPCSAKVQILHKRDVGQFAVNHETEGDVHWANGASEVVSTSVQVCSIDYFTRMPKFILFFLVRRGSKTLGFRINVRIKLNLMLEYDMLS